VARKPSAHLALVVSSAFFASGYILARAIDPEVGMWMFVAQAMLFCALTLSFFGRRGATPRVSARAAFAIFFNGASSPIIVFMVMEGSRLVTPALASIIVISNVLMIAALARVLGRKKFTTLQIVALFTGFIGIIWISVERGSLAGERTGVVYLLASAVIISVITISIEKPVVKIGWARVTQWSFWVGFAIALIAAITAGQFQFHSPLQTLLAVVVGSLSLGAPVLLFNLGMSIIGSADAAAFKLLIPFFALVYGAIFLGQTPSMSSSAAGLLVAGSLAVYQFSNQSYGHDMEEAVVSKPI